MTGPIPLLKDMPGFLYRDIAPIAWIAIVPFMLLWILWSALITPFANWNERED